MADPKGFLIKSANNSNHVFQVAPYQPMPLRNLSGLGLTTQGMAIGK
jgi:hypothetical protein